MACEPPRALLEGLGVTPQAVLVAADHLVVLGTEDEVRGLRPVLFHFMRLGPL